MLMFFIIGVILLSPYHIKKLFKFSELPKLKASLSANKDIILFGSSVNEYYSPDDTDKRSIAKMLDSYISGKSLTGISHCAYHADIYLEYVKYINRSGKKPTIIIPINLRYFSPGWDLRPGYQFTKEKFLLNEYSFLTNLNFLINLQRQQLDTGAYSKAPVYNGNKLIGTVKDFERVSDQEDDKLSEMKKGFIFNYMQPLNINHRKLNSLLKICEIGNTNNLNIIMYITPIDYRRAEKLKITRFKQQQYDNIKTIKSALSTYTVDLIDLSMELDSSYFHYNKRPNEHLNMKGRQKVAKALRSAIYNTGKNLIVKNNP